MCCNELISEGKNGILYYFLLYYIILNAPGRCATKSDTGLSTCNAKEQSCNTHVYIAPRCEESESARICFRHVLHCLLLVGT
jgi:hypothetical protein